MSHVADRIGEWTYSEPSTGRISILILLDGNQHRWIAIDTVKLEPIAKGGPHVFRYDAVVDAIEHVPNWNIIRTL